MQSMTYMSALVMIQKWQRNGNEILIVLSNHVLVFYIYFIAVFG